MAPAAMRQGIADLAALERELEGAGASLLVRGIANSRLAELLALPAQSGLDPEAVYRLGERLAFDVALAWSADGPPGSFDAAFRRDGDAALLLPPPPAASPDANFPQFGRLGRRLLADLRRALPGRLPDHMVPAKWMLLDALPLTPSGEVDRQALPVPDEETTSAPAASRSPAEEMIAGIWAEILGRDAVGADEDFFLLGGHSLLATQVIARNPHRFRRGGAAEMAVRGRRRWQSSPRGSGRCASARVMTPIAARPPDAPPVLSFAQRRLWFLHRLEGPSAAYNTPGVFELTGPLASAPRSPRRCGRSSSAHAVLRTIFPDDDGEPRPRDHARGAVRAAGISSWSTMPSSPPVVAAETSRPFDIGSELPLRALLIRLGARRHVLAVTMHHIVSDSGRSAFSRASLPRCMRRAIERRDAGFSPLPLSFFDYAAWQQVDRRRCGDDGVGRVVARPARGGARRRSNCRWTGRVRPKAGLRAAAVAVALRCGGRGRPGSLARRGRHDVHDAAGRLRRAARPPGRGRTLWSRHAHRRTHAQRNRGADRLLRQHAAAARRRSDGVGRSRAARPHAVDGVGRLRASGGAVRAPGRGAQPDRASSGGVRSFRRCSSGRTSPPARIELPGLAIAALEPPMRRRSSS